MSNTRPENDHRAEGIALWSRERALMLGSLICSAGAALGGEETYRHSQYLAELTPGNTSPLGLAILGVTVLGASAVAMGDAATRSGRR